MTEAGHNNPPPFESLSMALEEAYDTAKDFLDGDALETQGQADAVGKIISEVKQLKKKADDERKAEKKPHDDAGKAVQAKWRPLLERADTIVKAAQAPLTAYLSKLAAEQEAEARKAREEAAQKAREALEAERSASGSVEDIEAAKALQAEAEAAQKAASKAGKQKAHVAGAGRAAGLRTYKVATVTDYKAALLWIAKNDKAKLDTFIDEYARTHAVNFPMDGVEVTTERRVV